MIRKNFLKIMSFIVLIIIVFLLQSAFAPIVLIIVALFFGTARGLNLFRKFFAEKTEVKFLVIIIGMITINYFRITEFNIIMFSAILFLVCLLFGTPFLLLKWKNKTIDNAIPTIRDFYVLLFIISSQFIIYYMRVIYADFPNQLLSMFWSPLTILLCLILFLIVRNFNREDIGYTLNISIIDIIYLICGFIFLEIIFLTLNFGIDIWNSRYILEYFYNDIFQRYDSTIGSYFSYFVIGLDEELTFRGLLLGFIRKKFEGRYYGTFFALVVSSFAFGFLHYYKHGFYGSLWDCVIGLVLGFIFIRTKRLPAPILLHAFLDLH